MTQTQALEAAKDLKSHIDRWWRKTRCSIELRGGRGSDPWYVPKKPLRMQHHTAAAYRGVDGNKTPALYICKNGRPDVPGPLCNGYGGFDWVYRIICMGLANHPGLGGPITIDGVYVPKDSARTPTWGTEWEGGLQDYETIPGMMDFMGAVDCALAEFGMLGVARPLTSQMEHKTWAPTRKIDRRGFDRARGIALTTQMHKKYNPVVTPPTIQGVDPMATFFYRTKGKEWRLYDGGVIVDLPYEQSGALANEFIGVADAATKHLTGKIIYRRDNVSALLYEYITAAGQSKRDQAPGFVAKITETGKRVWVTMDRSGKISEEVNPDEFAAIVWVVTKNGFDLTPQPYAAAQLEGIPELSNID